MGTVRKTVTLTDQQSEWNKARIAEGGFANDSDYIRDLVRRDQQHRTTLDALRAAIQEGLQGGDSDRTIADIVKGVERRLRADGRL
jgi:antitoxin ParD1/3/4